MSTDSLSRFMRWYGAQADGDWEHTDRVSIRSLDNPGWRLTVNLEDTYTAPLVMKRVEVERSSDDWYTCWLEEEKFEAAGGPRNLAEMMSVFCDWVEALGSPVD